MTVTTRELGPQVPLMSNSPGQWAAVNGMVLRVLVGSGVHGTAIDGYDDRDEMGVCIEPSSSLLGLRHFEHYVFRTQPEGVRSGPGDLDLTVYSLRKYVRLALQGSPTILLALFVPDDAVLYSTWVSDELRRADWILSRQLAPRFLGYLHGQREAMLGRRAGAKGSGRQELIREHGFDTKFAHHMVRLGLQGAELLETGRITLPIPEPDLTWLRDLRLGKYTRDEALAAALDLENRIRRARTRSPLPEGPDRAAADRWLVDVHRRWWGWNG